MMTIIIHLLTSACLQKWNTHGIQTIIQVNTKMHFDWLCINSLHNRISADVIYLREEGVKWLSGRVLDWRVRGCGLEPRRRP